jgi:hypothetical protein
VVVIRRGLVDVHQRVPAWRREDPVDQSTSAGGALQRVLGVIASLPVVPANLWRR